MVHDAVVIVSIEGDYEETYKFPEAPPSDFTPIESIKQQQQQLIHQRGSGRGGFFMLHSKYCALYNVYDAYNETEKRPTYSQTTSIFHKYLLVLFK
jgi:hypothetical protein